MCTLFIHVKYTNVNLLYKTVTATNFCVLCKFINSPILHTESCCGTNLHFTQDISCMEKGLRLFAKHMYEHEVCNYGFDKYHTLARVCITFHNFKTMTRKNTIVHLLNRCVEQFVAITLRLMSVDMLIINYL